MTDSVEQKKVVFRVPAEEGWGAAIAAQRMLGQYIKLGEVVYTKAEEGVEPKPLPSNRELITDLLANRKNEITDEDVAQGIRAREWFQGQLFALIGEQLNDFMKKAAELAVKDEIVIRTDLGMLACLPQTWLRADKKEQVQSIIEEIDSHHVGAITEKLIRHISVLDVKAGQTFTGWLVTATDGKDLFRFCTSVQFEPNETVQIQGKVKRHDNDRGTDKPVTWLNYVKKLL